jgi:hypothetical protein
MSQRHPDADKALVAFIKQTFKLSDDHEVVVYEFRAPDGSMRVTEMSVISRPQKDGVHMTGSSWMRSVPENADVILYCEEFLLLYGVQDGEDWDDTKWRLEVALTGVRP